MYLHGKTSRTVETLFGVVNNAYVSIQYTPAAVDGKRTIVMMLGVEMEDSVGHGVPPVAFVGKGFNQNSSRHDCHDHEATKWRMLPSWVIKTVTLVIKLIDLGSIL